MSQYICAMVQWYNGAMINDVMVQRCNGVSATAFEILWVLTSDGALGCNYVCFVAVVWLWGLGDGRWFDWRRAWWCDMYRVREIGMTKVVTRGVSVVVIADTA